VHTDTACLVNGPDVFYRDGLNIARWTFLGYHTVHDVMAAHCDGDKPIWMSELGWSLTNGGPTSCKNGMWAGQKPSGVSEAVQAEFLTKAFGCLAATPFVTEAAWFTLHDLATSQEDMNHYGLLRRDGSPKPSWAAFRAVALAGGGARIASHFSKNGWTITTVVTAMTLRHAIAKTGANTLEGYFHPRMAAFALGLFAVASVLERRAWLSVVLLAGAGLLLRSFLLLSAVDPGFAPQGRLAFSVSLPDAHYDTPEKSAAFFTELLTRLRALPEVSNAGLVSGLPLTGYSYSISAHDLDGRALSNDEGDRLSTQIRIVTPDYFRTMGIPQLAGAGFASMTDSTSPQQVIVNEEFVRRYFHAADPIGRHIRRSGENYTVAGVVKNSFYDAFGEAPIPLVYFSYRDRPRASGEIHIRSAPGSEALLAGEVRRAWREVEDSVPLFNVRTMSEHLETNLFIRRIPARLFTVLGPLLLFFAAIGVYGVVAYTMAHRVTEIGIRIALGATVTGVVRQIMAETMRVIATGAAAGLLIAFIVYIHVVPGGPLDPRVFVGIPAILLLMAATACWIPARRTAGIDPMIALREQS